MQVFIDKENAISLAKSRKLGAAKYDNCMRLLKYHGDLIFHFPKDELKTSEDLMDWIKIFTDGIQGEEAQWGKPLFPPRPLKANLYKGMSIEQLSSTYLVDDEKAEMVYNRRVIQLSPLGKEIDVLSNLILTEDGQYTHTLEPQHMSGWQDLNGHQSPLSDIIMVDQYIFSDENVVESNFNALLSQICSIAPGTKINIVLFTLPDIYIKETKVTVTPDFEKLKNGIEQTLKTKYDISASVTFVLSHELEEHDRTLFTNMKYYVSGDSYNYFDSQNKVITKGRYLHIHSMASRTNYNIGIGFVHDMQNIIEKVEKLNNNDLIKGKKESNYLHFS